jgi:uncharacterized protein involved in exopolysaccharide biosynthesis
MQIQALVESINRVRDRRLLVERSSADLTAEEQASTVVGSAEPSADAPASRQLAYYEKLLADMELRLKPEHPDLIRMRRTVAGLRQRAESEALARPLSADTGVPFTPAQAQRRARLKDLQGELEGLDRQIAAKRAEEDRLRRQASTYQSRLEAMPARETELIELTRDYSTLQQMYASLLAKNEESKIAANLERRQIGEQFKVLDPARRSERPFSPNRLRINMVGALGGLVLGMGLAAFLAYRDTSFRTTQDVAVVLSLPVLAQIPLLTTPAERHRMRRRRWAVSLGALLLCVGAGTFAWWTGAWTLPGPGPLK